MPPDEPKPAACTSEPPIEITPGSSRSPTTIQNAILDEDCRLLRTHSNNLPHDRYRTQRAALVDESVNGDRTSNTADPINITDAPPE